MSDSIRNDFPFIKNNPGLIFFDSTASTQKPQYVIDAMSKYLGNDYANIHRGAYSLAEKSENMYEKSKKKMAEFLGASSWREVIYSFNSTYAANLLVTSIKRTGILKKGDVILVSIVEHHANVVPWLILKEEIGIELDFIAVDENYGLDYADLEKKLENPKVKIVSITHVSNVTGEVFDLEKVGSIVKGKNKTGQTQGIAPTGNSSGEPCVHHDRLFIVDASQSFPHFKVDVKKLQCDALFCTAHKFGADGGMGILWGKTNFLMSLKPGLSGGGAISWVKKDSFESAGLPDRFEPGTPNLSGAVSILSALEYIEKIGGYTVIEEIEKKLTQHFLKKIEEIDSNSENILSGQIKIIGSKSFSRVGVFSFNIKGIHPLDVAEYLAEYDICVRGGQHCAEPFMDEIGVNASCRASFWIYNTTEEIDKFFEILAECKKMLG